MKRIALFGPLLVTVTLVTACAHGPQGDGPKFDRTERAVLNSEGFLGAHPDLRWRRAAVASLREGRTSDALVQFKRAARYADKPSQAMIAEMLWTGRGVEVNRPLGYAWMDIAAERGYAAFIAKREQYWADLSPAERQEALAVGWPLMAKYGDAVAKPRLNRILVEERRDITGSRTGFVGNLQLIIPGPGGIGISVDAEDYYADEFWVPEQYWALQDEIWKAPPPPVGEVTVRPLEQVREAAQAQDASSAQDDGG